MSKSVPWATYRGHYTLEQALLMVADSLPEEIATHLLEEVFITIRLADDNVLGETTNIYVSYNE